MKGARPGRSRGERGSAPAESAAGTGRRLCGSHRMRDSTDLGNDDLAALAGPVAAALFGEPNPRLSCGANLRFGRNGSLSLDADAGRWKDFESDAGGGVLDLVIHAGAADSRRSAMAWLKRFDGREAPVKAARPTAESAPAPRTDTREFARRIWRETKPIAGTVAADYLVARGVGHVADAPSLRFHHALRHPNAPGRFPALVAGVQDVQRRFLGIQRTYLDGADKAKVAPVRATLGSLSGGAVRLSEPVDRLLLGEGIETTAAAALVLGFPGGAWATLGTSGLRAVELPADVQDVVIAADRDAKGAGQLAAAALGERLMDEGRSVAIRLPPFLCDWCDVLKLARGAA